ncbi:MAG: META domain-containing protein [Acidobacteriota bacterium]
MRFTATRSFLLLSALILFASAGVFAKSGKLDNTQWKLVEANGKAVTNSSAAIDINGDSTKFTGSTGCNRMFGGLWVRGINIGFQNIGTTKMMCKLMAGNVAEGEFLKALGDARRFRVNGDLRLLDGRGRTLLRFTRVRSDQGGAIRLQDKKWVLESIKGRQTFVALPYAFINFDADKGGAGGDSSCNVYGGNYSVHGKSIAITNVISTMRACIEDDKMSVEREMLDGLRKATRFEIKDNSLSLYRSKELLLTFRGENK